MRGSRWRSRDRRTAGRPRRGCSRWDGRRAGTRAGPAGTGHRRLRIRARGALPGVPGPRRRAVADRRRRHRAPGDDPLRPPKDHPPRGRAGRGMSERARMAVFGAGVLGFAAVLVWGLGGLPDFGDFAGRYGDYLAHTSVPQRHATSAISVTTFDFRGVDTLIE